MQKAESVQESDSTATNAIDTRLLYAGGLIVLGGLAILAYERFNNKPRTPEMSPVKPRPPTPMPQQNLDMD